LRSIRSVSYDTALDVRRHSHHSKRRAHVYRRDYSRVRAACLTT
jgi:hypothetical protein